MGDHWFRGADADDGPMTDEPLLAASLIVRDEAANLPECLASLQGIVDEVVVYDTGSTDDTVAIGRKAGAQVVEGYWDDDFSRARNAGLVHVSAQWVLVVDADDRLTADRSRLRRMLKRSSASDAYLVRVDSPAVADLAALSTDSVRLFRWDRAQYSGVVHEQVTARRPGPSGKPPKALRIGTAAPAILRIEHLGYADVGAVQDKTFRNARLARRTLDALLAAGCEDPQVIAEVALNLGRSLISSGSPQEAVDVLEVVRELVPGSPHALSATDFLAQLLLADGKGDVVMVLVQELRDGGADAQYCDWLRAHARLVLGDLTGALELLRGVSRLAAPGGRTLDDGLIIEARAHASARFGQRLAEVTDELIVVMAEHGVTGLTRLLLDVWGGDDAEELAARLRAHGDRHLVTIAAELRETGGAGAAVADALAGPTA
jgi:hypothetical protein